MLCVRRVSRLILRGKGLRRGDLGFCGSGANCAFRGAAGFQPPKGGQDATEATTAPEGAVFFSGCLQMLREWIRGFILLVLTGMGWQ